MTTLNYSDLTINQILELADGDLDQAELASRIVRRLSLDTRKRIGRLSESDARDLVALAEVTDRYLALGGAR
jgi:hypothetical protein